MWIRFESWSSLLVALVACDSTTVIDVPPPILPSGTSAVLLALQTEEELQLHALDAHSGFRLITRVEGDIELTVLAYQHALADLGIPTGQLTLTTADQPSTTIPRFDDAFTAWIEGHDVSPWRDLDELDDALLEVRIALPSVRDCLASGGCQKRRGDYVYCAVPCEGGSPPELPTPPTKPQLTPCPDGWRTVLTPDGVDTATVCEPWPVSGRAACTRAGEGHFPGEPGCRRIGSVCPVSDEWGQPPAAPVTRYVLPGAPFGGDGSRAAPFSTIAEAMVQIPPSTLIALAKGTYNEEVELRNEVTLWGACVEETLVSSAVATVTVPPGEMAEIRNLHVSAGNSALEVRGVLRAEAVLLSGTEQAITIVDVQNGGSLRGSEILVRGASTWPPFAISAARAEVDRVLFDVAGFPGVVMAVSGATVALSNCSITAPLVGVYVASGGRSALHNCVVEDSAFAAFFATDEGSVLQLDQVVGRGHTENTAEVDPGGIQAVKGGRVLGSRVFLEHNRFSGIEAKGLGSAVEITDLVVRETGSHPIRKREGHAIYVHNLAEVVVMRALLSHNEHYSSIARDAGTRLLLSDVTAIDTEPDELEQRGGGGLRVEDDAVAEIHRLLVKRSLAAGVELIRGELIGSDLIVLDTSSRVSDGSYGHGLDVERFSEVDLTRVRLERNRHVSLLVHEQSSVKITDLTVSTTREPDDCLTGGCGWAHADGIGVSVDSSLDIERFEVVDSLACGINISATEVDLRHGWVAQNGTGISVFSSNFDFARIAEHVLVQENGRDFVFLAED